MVAAMPHTHSDQSTMSPSKFVLDIKHLAFLRAGPPLPSVIPADYIPNQDNLGY